MENVCHLLDLLYWTWQESVCLVSVDVVIS